MKKSSVINIREDYDLSGRQITDFRTIIKEKPLNPRYTAVYSSAL